MDRSKAREVEPRIAVNNILAAADLVSSVTMTTLVLTHNLLGRAHLTTILPFHRIIVRSMLQQLIIKPIV
jgi:hypothetical protein